MFVYETLENHYRSNFAMMQHHKYSLTELNEMLPWERMVYMGMLNDYIREENERVTQENAKMRKSFPKKGM